MVTALSAGASDMSGWLLMGLPGAIFISGISESWIAIGLTVGAWINWKLVAGRLRVHTEVNNNALTLPDYFTGRFEDNSRVLRIISAWLSWCSLPSIVRPALWPVRVCSKAPSA
jgi:sodium/proline symporter